MRTSSLPRRVRATGHGSYARVIRSICAALEVQSITASFFSTCAVYVASSVLGLAYRAGLIISSARGALHLRRVRASMRREREASDAEIGRHHALSANGLEQAQNVFALAEAI